MPEDLIVSAGIDTRQFNRDLQKATREVDKFGDNLDDAGRKGRGLASHLGGGLRTNVRNLGSSFKDTAAQGLKLSGLMAGGLVTGVGGLALALGGGAAAGLGFNNSMEKVTAQLNAFTKDGAKSAEILDMIKDRASKTPFAFEEMAKATVSLMSSARQAKLPLEDLVKEAEILAASNPAEGLEGAAFALKEAVSGDFTSIIERFNLPRSMINKLKDEGVPAIDIVRRAMQELGLDADLVGNLANTAEGKWSTLKDTFVNLAGEVTKPLFDTFSSGLGKVNEWLTANEPMLTKFAQDLAGTLSQAIQGAASFLSDLVRNLSGFWQAYSSGDPEKIKDFFREVGGWVGKLGPGLVDAAGELGHFFEKILNTEPVRTLKAAWDDMWANNKNEIKVHSQEWTDMYANNQSKLTEFDAAWQEFHREVIAPIAKMKQEWDVFWTGVGTALSEFQAKWNAYWLETEGELNAFIKFWDEFWFGVQSSLTDFQTGWNDFWGHVGRGLEEFGEGWGNFWRNLAQSIDNLVSGAIDLGANIVSGIKQGILNAWSGLVSWFKGLVPGLLDAGAQAIEARSPSHMAASEIGEPIAQGVFVGIDKVWQGLARTFVSKVQNLINETADIADRMYDKIQNAAALHSTKYANIMDGMYQKVQRAAFEHGNEMWAIAESMYRRVQQSAVLNRNEMLDIENGMYERIQNAAVLNSTIRQGIEEEMYSKIVWAARVASGQLLAAHDAGAAGLVASAASTADEVIAHYQRMYGVIATGPYSFPNLGSTAPEHGVGGGGRAPVPMQHGGITRGEGLAYLHPNEVVAPLRDLPAMAGGDVTLIAYFDGVPMTPSHVRRVNNALATNRDMTAPLPAGRSGR